MVAPALSISISHTSFQAELEGAILQQTASVDYYLQTAAPKWSADSYQDHGDSTGLRSLFLSDLSSCPWPLNAHNHEHLRGFFDLGPAVVPDPPWPVEHCKKRRPRSQPVQADASDTQLEQFLQDDLQRFMQLREQLDHQACASDAAVLASSAEEHRRRLSNSSSSGISFVKLPEDSLHNVVDDADNEHHPVAAALAAAAAMAAVNDVAPMPSSLAGSLRVGAHTAAEAVMQPTEAAGCAPMTGADEATGAAGQQHQNSTATTECSQGSSTSTAAAAAAGTCSEFVMQPDEEIAAQKRAARVRLAELQQKCTAAQQEEVLAAAADSTGKGFQKWSSDGDDAADLQPGIMHSSKVPERPRGLTALAHSRALAAEQSPLHRFASRLYELSMAGSDGVLLQHNQFLQHMLAGLVLCVVLLPVLWLLQADGGRGAGIVRSFLPATLLARAEQMCNLLYVCSAAGVLLYCLVRSLLLQPPLLHFRESALERQYLLWSNAGRLFQDCVFQLTFLVVGSCLWLRLLQGGSATGAASTGHLVLSGLTLLGSGLPVVMLILLRSSRYVQWRELLLAGSRLCSVMALSVMQFAAGPGGALQLNMPFIALAQVMSIACMQVRLSSFVPSQVLHLLVLLVCTKALNPLLQFTQLFGGWLCLPCLVLYSMEMHSRKAFLATLAPAATATSKVAL